jgi:hypothetical protein
VEKLGRLGATTVVAGHKKPGLPDDATSIEYTRTYLVEFEKALRSAKTSEQLATAMRARFPDTIDALDDFILTNSSKVATGEAPPWAE